MIPVYRGLARLVCLRFTGIPGSGDVEKFAQTRYTGVWRRFKGCKIPVYRRPASKGLTPDIAPLVSQSDGIDNISFSSVLVARALHKIKPSQSCGPDGLPSVLYNKLSKSLAHPLSIIFKSFMLIGKVPDEWCSAIVTPAHKGVLASIISNY